MKTIGITGGSGFVGSHLTDYLVKKGNKVIIFTRSTISKPKRENIKYSLWEPKNGKCDLRLLGQIDAVINLAGAGIADKRWTRNRRQEIFDSRVQSTGFLIERLRHHAPQCKTFISASAIGIYGPDRAGISPFKESATAYHDFLANVCNEWEKSAHQAEAFERTVIFRFGIVLGTDGGAFKSMNDPTKLGFVPILGDGKQIMSWVHIDDLSEMIHTAITDKNYSGVYNAVAPHPVSQKEIAGAILKNKKGIAFRTPVPAFALKMLLGKASGEALKSCTVSGEKILSTGFRFQYDTIEKAVENLLTTQL